MSIQVTCDTCYYSFTVGDRNAGKRGKCPECGEAVRVPAGEGRPASSRKSGSSRSRAASSADNNSQQKKLLIGGGIAGGVIIVVLVAAVAYLAGRAGNNNEGPSARVAEVETEEPASVESVTTPAAPIAPVPNHTSGPLTNTAATETAKTSTAALSTPTPTPADEPEPKPSPAASQRFTSVADLIEAVEPSVCRINVESSQGSSTGSGFVIDDRGIIATNYHVIEGALRATVIFPDETKAKVLGFHHLDAKKDIALIAIEPPASSLAVVKLATELPRKGEVLVAIGAPLGLDFSASEGKVAAIRSEEDLQQFGADKEGTWIQSTAPISPGNSGGPLFNMKGEVVAANTMTITVGQNLNFGISAGDIANAITKLSDKPVALSPTSVPKVATSHNRGERGKPIDGTSSARGRDLLAGLSEVQLLVASFSFDPTGNVNKYVLRLAENTLKQADLEQKTTNAALLAVFMRFDRSGSGGKSKALVIEAHIVVRDNNEFVTVWKDKEDVGSFSASSFVRGNIPTSVRTKVVKFFNGLRSARKKAINEAEKSKG